MPVVVRRKILKDLFWSPRPLMVIPLLVLIGTFGGLIYWYRFAIEAVYVSLLEKVIATVGVSVIPIALWSIALVFAAIRHRGWLRRVNVWAGLLLLIVAAAGIFSFYEPTTGIVAIFALNGEVSLGGSFGEKVSGSTTGLGMLRVFVIAALSVIVAFPRPTGDLVAVILRGSLSLYILVALILRSITRLIITFYQFKTQSSSDVTHSEHYVRSVRLPEDAVAGNLPNSGLGRDITSRADAADIRMTGTEPVHSESVSLSETDEGSDVSELDSGVYVYGNEWTDSNIGVSESSSGEESTDDKSNRFWKVVKRGSEEATSTTEVEDARDGSMNQAHDTDKPWEMPPPKILVDAVEGDISETEMAATAETIRRTLVEYGVEVESGEIKPGPAVTMYGLIPGWVRRYKQTKALDEKGIPKLDASCERYSMSPRPSSFSAPAVSKMVRESI